MYVCTYYIHTDIKKTYVSVSIYIYICMPICVYMYISLCVCVYVHNCNFPRVLLAILATITILTKDITAIN